MQVKYLKLFVFLALLSIISFPSSIFAQTSNQTNSIQNETKFIPPEVQSGSENITKNAELGVNTPVRTYLYDFTNKSKLPSFTSEVGPQVVTELNETAESETQENPEIPITKELDVKNLEISPETNIVDPESILNASKLSTFPDAPDRLFLSSISLNSDLPSLRQIQIMTTPPRIPIRNLPVTNIPTGRLDTLLEPSVANNDRTVFYTGNWFAARSTDGGQSWTHVDVLSDMPSFCCDQEVIYSPNRDIFAWVRQDKSGFFKLGISTDAITWRFYDFRPTDVDRAYFPSNPRWTPWFDRPQLALSDMHLFVTTSVKMGFGDGTNGSLGDVIIRFNLDQLREGILTGNNLPRPHVMSGPDGNNFVPVQGATNKMYWGLHLTNHNMRIYSWNDNTMGYWWVDREITPYLPSGQGSMICTSPDGINWCYRISDRATDKGWIRGGLIAFYWNVQQDPPEVRAAKRAQGVTIFPFPYIQLVYFRENQLQNFGYQQIWNRDRAIVEPSIVPTSRGLGFAAFVGGSSWYPSLFVGNLFPYAPPSHLWWLFPVAMGTRASPPEIVGGNFVRDSGGNLVTRWGDYLTVRPFAGLSGAGPYWIAAGFVLQGGNAPANVRPMYVIFGSQ